MPAPDSRSLTVKQRSTTRRLRHCQRQQHYYPPGVFLFVGKSGGSGAVRSDGKCQKLDYNASMGGGSSTRRYDRGDGTARWAPLLSLFPPFLVLVVGFLFCLARRRYLATVGGVPSGSHQTQNIKRRGDILFLMIEMHLHWQYNAAWL